MDDQYRDPADRAWIVQANIAMLELSPRQQGLGLIVIGIIMALLRAKTTTALSER